MWVHASVSAVEVWTPAKLNLFLEVLSQRADGYHEIETLMVPVSLCDWLHFSASSSEAERATAIERATNTSGFELSARWASSAWKAERGVSVENGSSNEHPIPQGAESLFI